MNKLLSIYLSLCALLVPLNILAEATAQAVIPLCPGLKIVTAISQTGGDYESVKLITAVTPEGITLHYSSEREVDDPLSDKPPKLETTNVSRKILSEDQVKAPYYLAAFSEILPETLPKSTAISISTNTYAKLKQSGKAEISLISTLNGTATAETVIDPNSPFRWWFAPSVYLLDLAEAEPVKFPLLVNGVVTDLPALHAKGSFGSEKAEFFILDDPKNPLMLKFRLGIGYNTIQRQMIENDPSITGAFRAEMLKSLAADEFDKLHVIQISFGCERSDDSVGRPTSGKLPGGSSGDPGDLNLGGGGGAAKNDISGLNLSGLNLGGEKAERLESALRSGEKVDIYDIFFSFNSANLRPESDDTLRLISALLRRNPDWELSIGGHTDSVASDTFNLDLSKRRAAAVKQALATRFNIDGTRLTAEGYGEGSPRASNDTLEGRARNRRVELIRRSPTKIGSS